MESVCLSEAEEASCEEVESSESETELDARGEDLDVSADRDRECGSSPDEYDYSDEFIDDGPLRSGSGDSSSGGSDDDFCSTTKRNIARGRGGGRQSKLESRRPERGFYSESEEDCAEPVAEAGDRLLSSGSSGRRAKAPDPRYKRALLSDYSDGAAAEEGMRRPSKRAKKRESPNAASGERQLCDKESSASLLTGRRRGTRDESKSLGRTSKRQGGWDVRNSFDGRGGVSGRRAKKTQGGKGGRIKRTSGLSTSQASTSGVTRWTGSYPTEKGRRPKDRSATSESDSESQERPGYPGRKVRSEPSTGYLDSSTEAKRSVGRAWIGSEDESERGGSEEEEEEECDLGPAREEKRKRVESGASDSCAETEERDLGPAREEKRKRAESRVSDSCAETDECGEPGPRDARRERVDQREVVRSGGEGEETGLRLSQIPAPPAQQSRLRDADRAGGEEGIESDEESSTASDVHRSEDEAFSSDEAGDSDEESTEGAARVISM